jgi:NitT/TauT family transport system ATP-binding protein
MMSIFGRPFRTDPATATELHAGTADAAGPVTVDCRAVSKVYRTPRGDIAALDTVSFTLHHREILCIVGPSGCGKTTLLKLVAGLLSPSSGDLVYGVPTPAGAIRAALVFQEHALFPWMSVLDNVTFGLDRRLPRRERLARAHAFIDRVGLSRFRAAYPHELSVGMRQRVALARAFLTEAPILLLDEPFGSLDAQTRIVLQQELLQICEAQPTSVIYVTHDVADAVLLGDRVLVITGQPGRVTDEIPVRLPRPRDPLARDLGEVRALTERVWRRLEHDVRERLGLIG